MEKTQTWLESAFRRAIEEAGAAIAAFSADGRQTYMSPAFCELAGWSAEELLGQAPPFVYWPPEEYEHNQAMFAAMMQGEPASQKYELQFLRRNGERFGVRVTAAPIRGAGARAVGWVMWIADTSDSRRAEQRRSAEHEAVRILGMWPTLEDAAPRILRALCEHLHWDAGAVWKSNDGPALSPVAEVSLIPSAYGNTMTEGWTFAAGSGLPGRVLATGKPAWIPDVALDSGFLRAAAVRQKGLRGAFAFPIITGTGVAGVVELFSRRVRPADDDLLGTVGALGRQIGQFVERERIDAALRHSEERYRSIVETADEGVWLLDGDGRTRYANRRLADMLHAAPEEMPGKRVTEFCFAGDETAARDLVAAGIRGARGQFDFRFRRQDGSELLVLASTSPMRDPHGGAAGVLWMLSDITGRRRQEEDAERLAAIVENSDDAIIGKTLDGTILTWNSGAERIYGYTAEEAIGQSMAMLLPPDRAEEETVILERLQRGERVDHFETVRVQKSGRAIRVATTVSPIRDKAGRIVGASSVTRDITERKAFEDQLRETQKLESLGVLAGGVAHDFNNLLVGIMGNASLALETLGPENRERRMIEEVLQASERAAGLTSQLLAYSGKGRFVVQPVDLSQVIRDMVGLVHMSIPKNVRIEFDLDEGLPAVEADVTQMQQLIMNLVINGAEAVGEAQGVVRIRTGACGPDGMAAAGGGWVRIDVEDTGCGMDEATQARIFEPFFTTKFAGRGLGLAAALGIVRGHKGSITISSTVGQGSTFTVLFPAMEAKAVWAKPAAFSELGGSGTVLVIDDEEIVRRTAQATLERYGYKVLVASDGREALESLSENPDIGLVLLDLTMPLMSGVEALREMRRLRPDLPVILSSGYNEVEAMRRFEGQGLAGFVQKPYTAERLVKKVKAALVSRNRGSA